MVEPQHAGSAQAGGELALDLLLGDEPVAVDRQHALRCGQDGAVAVALDGAPLKHIPLAQGHRCAQGLVGHERQEGEVVFVRRELEAPAVELVCDSREAAVGCVFDGERAVVASPGVVGGATGYEQVACGHVVGQQRLDPLRLGCGDDNLLPGAEQGLGQVGVASVDIVEHVSPVGVVVWPRYEGGVES